MKNSADLGGCYPPRTSASVDNTLLYLQNSSYPTQPHSIIAKYLSAVQFRYSMRKQAVASGSTLLNILTNQINKTHVNMIDSWYENSSKPFLISK